LWQESSGCGRKAVVVADVQWLWQECSGCGRITVAVEGEQYCGMGALVVP
jgi:hypothetical protein